LQNRLLAQRRQAELEKKGKVKKKEGPSVEVPRATTDQIKQSEDKFWSLVTKYKPDRAKYNLGDDAGEPQSETNAPEQDSSNVEKPIPCAEAGTRQDDELVEPANDEAVSEATKIESGITAIPQDEEKIDKPTLKDVNSFVEDDDDDDLPVHPDRRKSQSQSVAEYDTDDAQDAYADDFENSKPASRENVMGTSTVPSTIGVSDHSAASDDKSVNEAPVQAYGNQLRAVISEAACEDGLLQTNMSDADLPDKSEKDDKEKVSIAAADDEKIDECDVDPSLIQDRELPTELTEDVNDNELVDLNEKMADGEKQVISAQGSILLDGANEDDQLNITEPKNIEQDELVMDAADKTVSEKENVHPVILSDTITSKDTVSQVSDNESDPQKPKEKILKVSEVEVKSPVAEKIEPEMSIDEMKKIEAETSKTSNDQEDVDKVISNSDQPDTKKEQPSLSAKDIPVVKEEEENEGAEDDQGEPLEMDDYEDEFEGGDENISKDTSPVPVDETPLTEQEVKEKLETQPVL